MTASDEPWRYLAPRRRRAPRGGTASSPASTPRSPSVSKVRAEELLAEGRGGARRLLTIAEDPPRYFNTALFLRMLCEITAIVLVAEVVLGHRSTTRWLAVLATVRRRCSWCQFVVIGVGPRTIGRIHAQRVALVSAGFVVVITRILGPLPQLLIVLGNILTPGRGLQRGTVLLRGRAA